MIVDSRPIWQRPPSRIRSISGPKSRATCAAVTGLTRPERLADGAASGRPAAAITASATGCAGTRSATLCKPARAAAQTVALGASGTTRVRGPGQKASASRTALLEKTPCSSAASRLSTWEMSGLDVALPSPHKCGRQPRPRPRLRPGRKRSPLEPRRDRRSARCALPRQCHRVRRQFLLRGGRGTTRDKIAFHPPIFVLDDTTGTSGL